MVKNVIARQSVERQVAALEDMPTAGLRAEWLRLYQFEPPKRLSRKTLQLVVAWRIQEQAYGGLSAWAKRRLAGIAKDIEAGTPIRPDRASRLRPGARLVREWHGEIHTVTATDAGFEWRGQTWRSLSVIAREITGSAVVGAPVLRIDICDASEASRRARS